MRADVVLLEQLAPQVLGQRVEGGARVGKVGVAARLGGRDLDGAQQRVGRAARVEGRVDVEEAVAAVLVRPRRVRRDDVVVLVEVARVEELDVVVAQLAARGEVARDGVEVAEAVRELDVRVVGEARLAEDADAVL